MDSDFVGVDVERLPLSGGAWIEVKKELTAGEQRKVLAKLVKTMHFNEKAEVDPEQVGFSKVVAYLVGWSFTANGKAMPITENNINQLRGNRYAEIVKAIDDHEEKVEKEIEARKNDQGDGTKSNPTLSSVA